MRVTEYHDRAQREAATKRGPNVPRMVTDIVAMGDRNRLIVDLVAAERAEGRRVIVLSDRKEHLRELDALLAARRLPGTTAGFYVGGMKAHEREESNEAEVVWATFAMASEGYDNARLNTVLLASPKSDVEQSVGRILRGNDGRELQPRGARHRRPVQHLLPLQRQAGPAVRPDELRRAPRRAVLRQPGVLAEAQAACGQQSNLTGAPRAGSRGPAAHTHPKPKTKKADPMTIQYLRPTSDAEIADGTAREADRVVRPSATVVRVEPHGAVGGGGRQIVRVARRPVGADLTVVTGRGRPSPCSSRASVNSQAVGAQSGRRLNVPKTVTVVSNASAEVAQPSVMRIRQTAAGTAVATLLDSEGRTWPSPASWTTW